MFVYKNSQIKFYRYRYSVLWIRIGFNEDPDLVFYLNADMDPDQEAKPMRIRFLVRL